MSTTIEPSTSVDENRSTLRMVWPQCQGAGVVSEQALFPAVAFEDGRRDQAWPERW